MLKGTIPLERQDGPAENGGGKEDPFFYGVVAVATGTSERVGCVVPGLLAFTVTVRMPVSGSGALLAIYSAVSRTSWLVRSVRHASVTCPLSSSIMTGVAPNSL
jgi:hypothetical protein